MELKKKINIIPIIQLVASLVALIVEEPGKGEEKKKKAVTMIKDLLKSSGIHIPEPFLSLILPIVIDKAVDILNQTIWKVQN